MMREALLAEELGLPHSRLKEHENTISLPVFPGTDKSETDLYYHYHYLSQIAMRQLYTRIQKELYVSDPTQALVDELFFQLDQWRQSLPAVIQQDFEIRLPDLAHPARVVAVGKLQARYRISPCHIARPFLHKAVLDATSLSADESATCRRALQSATSWYDALAPRAAMPTFMPLKYFVSGHLFSQALIVQSLRMADSELLSGIIRHEISSFLNEAIDYMSPLEHQSPTVSRDRRVLSKLLDALPP